MFYLVQLTKIFKKHPFRLTLFLSMSFAFLIVSSNPQQVVELIIQKTDSTKQNPYFHALIDGRENHARISRNLTEIPGVEKVEVLPKEEIQAQVQSILTDLKVSVPADMTQLNYNGIKVFLSQGIKDHGQNLIRDYLTRLAGESNITLGNIVNMAMPIVPTKFKFFYDYLQPLTIALFFVFWFASFRLIEQPLQKNSYLIEQFQRRKKVSVKTYLSLFAVIIGMVTLPLLLFLDVQWTVAVAVVCLSLPFFMLRRRYLW